MRMARKIKPITVGSYGEIMMEWGKLMLNLENGSSNFRHVTEDSRRLYSLTYLESWTGRTA